MSRLALSSLVVLVALVGLPIGVQGQASMAGKWEFTYSTQRGPTSFTVTFQQEDGTLTGTAEMAGRGGGTNSFEISKGTIEGNEFSFAIVRTFGDNSFEQTFTGTVDGEAAKGTMSGGGGRRGGGGGQPIEWTAKKVPPGIG
jgi:hypothetical protein